LLGQDAREHPADSFLSLHTPGRTRWGAPLLLSFRLSNRRGRPTGTRHIGSPPRAETLSRGAVGAERSELALYCVAGAWHPAAFSSAIGHHPKARRAILVAMEGVSLDPQIAEVLGRDFLADWVGTTVSCACFRRRGW
jgi:hypothetical protein